MSNINFSEEMIMVLEDAKNIALHYHYKQIGTEHIFLAIVRFPEESYTKQLLSKYSISFEKLQY